ncbi:MAG TPA: glycoside hydrolase family 3 protein, partial [Bacteroidetes bacterium]|nr:glycoside hydrolase family 3 protein [Bacteroidota bacterium]
MRASYKKLISFFLFSALLFFHPSIIFTQITLRDKIAQMIMVGFSGTKLDDSLTVDLSQRNLGGVILFGWNCDNPVQIQTLTAKIRDAAKTPPFIAIDQEGGKVARLNAGNGFRNSYTAYEIGTMFNSADTAETQARTMASWLAESGINLNLAPVVDVNVYPQSPAIGALGRSFSADPAEVSRYAALFIEEFHKKNVICTLKHFPGHGSARNDSHLGFTDVTNTWTESELLPYQNLIAAGYNDMIMAGHLFNATIDSLYPASLSYKTITGLLRQKLNFTGVVVSDAMFMRAVSDNYGFEEAIELAIRAGTDILLYVTNLKDGLSLPLRVINCIEQKIQDGVIPESRIDESFHRIMKLKNIYLQEITTTEKVPTLFDLRTYPNPFR